MEIEINLLGVKKENFELEMVEEDFIQKSKKR